MNTNPLTEFQNYIFSHPIAGQVFNDLVSALTAEASSQILILTGPTGVGKSTLIKAATNRVINHYADKLIAEPDFIPVVTVKAVAPTGSSFNWRDFNVRLLNSQNEPLVDRKLLLTRQSSLWPDLGFEVKALEQSAPDAIRRAVENYLRLRRTKLLVIDEAHHLLLVGGKQQLECQFECLKSLAIETGVTILLSGTYRLLDILDQSGQLTRRSQLFNYRRYDQRFSEDRANFRKVLGFLEQRLSQYVPTRLDADADYFYRKSVGCIGILKDWLSRCLEVALQDKAPLIDAKFAERFALKNRGLLTILEESCMGEAKLADIDDSRVLDLLNNGILLDGNAHILARPRRPGKRNPARDPVGDRVL